MIEYGKPPTILKEYKPDVGEMMHYQYLPIRIPNQGVKLPNRLVKYLSMSWAVMLKSRELITDFSDCYVYLTAKTGWVEPGCAGNRMGWHADGFGSNGDLNFIWYDMNPTEFAVQEFVNVPKDDFGTLAAFDEQVREDCIVTYPTHTLMMLDESIVHRVNPDPQQGFRTFLKWSVSKHQYNLKGNSHNYLFDYEWEMFDREIYRNTDNKDFK